MKRIIATIAIALTALSASAQLSKFPQRNEITTIEENEQVVLEVFDAPNDSGHHYYLTVGNLGVGDDVIQFQVDPLFELFIPLGETLEEALETLENLKALYKSAPGDSMEISGCLCLGIPKEDQMEPVTVTYRKVLLSKMLEFSVKRGDAVRATHIGRTNFNSAVSGVKFYKKLHPKEK